MPFYRFGVIHGDPHLGNYQVRADNNLNLLDFGAIRVFQPKFISGVIHLYEAIRDGDNEKARHAYENWGFPQPQQGTARGAQPMGRVRLRAAAAGPGAPHPGARRQLLWAQRGEKVHAGLRQTGSVRPPREFVLMDRAALGLGSVFLRLKAELNWSELFHELIADFDPATVAERQKAALAEAGVPTSI